MAATPAVPNRIGAKIYTALTNSDSGITAFAGGGQANATLLQAQANIVSTVASNSDSVKLPPIVSTPNQLGSIGNMIFITNAASNSLAIFGSGSDKIWTASGFVTSALLTGGGSGTLLIAHSLGTWLGVGV
jgi:hypothetical protein